jgi:hypothetical protein
VVFAGDPYVGVTGGIATNHYPNGQKTVFSYYGSTNDSRLERISHSTINTQLSTFSYTYDHARLGVTELRESVSPQHGSVRFQSGCDGLSHVLPARLIPKRAVRSRFCSRFLQKTCCTASAL